MEDCKFLVFGGPPPPPVEGEPAEGEEPAEEAEQVTLETAGVAIQRLFLSRTGSKFGKRNEKRETKFHTRNRNDKAWKRNDLRNKTT